MAVEDRTEENTPRQNENMQEAFARAQQQRKQTGSTSQPSNASRQGEQMNQHNEWSLGSLGSIFAAPMGMNPAAEVLTKLTEALSNIYNEQLKPTFEISVIPMGIENYQDLDASIVVVVGHRKGDENNLIAFHTLILEGSVDPIAPREDNLPQYGRVTIKRHVSESYDSISLALVSNELARRYPQAAQVNAGSNTVQRDFQLNDKEIVFRLAANTASALSIEVLKNQDDYRDLSLTSVSRQDQLTIIPSFGNPEELDANGQPVRSDVKVTVVSVRPNQGRRGDAKSTKVAEIKGFMDIVYRPETQQGRQDYYGWSAPEGQPPAKRYAQHFVITDLAAALQTLPLQLLSLAQVQALAENQLSINAFRPRNTGGAADLHDIGVLGYEVNADERTGAPGQPIDTRTEAFNGGTLGRFMGTFFHPGILVSIDVAESGPNTWRDDVFAAAAAGDPDANAALIDAAMALTGDRFGDFYRGNGVVVTDNCNRIHLGHFTDQTGTVRDLRELDYLAVLSMTGNSGLDTLVNYSNSHWRLDVPLEVRLEARERIQNNLANITYTGFARRCTVDVAYLEALVEGIKACGLFGRLQLPYADNSGQERAVGAASVGLMGTGTSGLYNSGYSTRRAESSGAGYGAFAGRWGRTR